MLNLKKILIDRLVNNVRIMSAKGLRCYKKMLCEDRWYYIVYCYCVIVDKLRNNKLRNYKLNKNKKEIKKKYNVIKKHYSIVNVNKNKQIVEKCIKEINASFFIRHFDYSLFSLIEEKYKRSKEITKRCGDWEEKIMDISYAIGFYKRNKHYEKERLYSKELLLKNKIGEWKFKNYKKWLKIYESKREKKFKNPEYLELRRILSEIRGFKMNFERLWFKYWRSENIKENFFCLPKEKEIDYNCSIKKEFIAIDIENSTKIEIYVELKKNWEKKGYNVDLYKKKYDNSDELLMFEKEMLNSTWIEIVEREEEYTIYALYLKFICEVLSNKKLWVD